MKNYPEALHKLIRNITQKRPRTVVDHILKHGHITTDELKSLYGYHHPPRAARDVREQGVPLETFRIKSPDGRKIAAYRFAELSKLRLRKVDGRTALSKKIKKELLAQYGCRCFIYLEEVDERELQIDHRVPYEIAGDPEDMNPDDFMLLCHSANRAKSWSCEHCNNWTKKRRDVCHSCYWAYPENYTHVAMHQIRRLDLIWQNGEIEEYESIKNDATQAGKTLPDFVKNVLVKAIKH